MKVKLGINVMKLVERVIGWEVTVTGYRDDTVVLEGFAGINCIFVTSQIPRNFKLKTLISKFAKSI